MGLIISDLMLALLLIVVIGLVALRFSVKQDKKEASAERLEEQKREQMAQADSKRYQPGVPLICLNCETKFLGPLTDSGCPSCHTTSLVMTEEEYKNASNKVNL